MKKQLFSEFFLQIVCLIQGNVILLQAIIKNKENTNMLNAAYFYGYYFYFATSCEADGRM